MNYFFLFSLVVLLISCGNADENTPQEEGSLTHSTIEKPEGEPIFESQLYPNRSDWDHQETYTDTLEFLRYEDDYDYAFLVFKTKDGKEAQFVSSIGMDNSLNGSSCLVQWYIDTLYEAGEGDMPSLQEILDYVEVLEPVDNFESFIQEFALDLREKRKPLKSYTNQIIGYGESSNPGAACLLDYQDEPSRPLDLKQGVYENIQFLLPMGDFCEGYPGVADGLYCDNRRTIPSYTFITEAGDFLMKEFPLPEEYQDARMKEVIVIQDEFTLLRMYFIQTGVNWTLFIIDRCDCSA